MGTCIYCGEPAGLFRKWHSKCNELNTEGVRMLPRFIKQTFEARGNIDRLGEIIRDLKRSTHISDDQLRSGVLQAIDDCVDLALSDHNLTDEEVATLDKILHLFGLRLADVEKSAEKLAKAYVLRVIDGGQIESILKRDTDIPLRLKDGEGVLWTFQNVRLYTYRSKTQYVGGSQGVSLRIAKGVYYRVGASKGQAVKTDYLSEDAHGALFLTNMALYFLSDRRTITLPATKIVAVELFSDAVKVTRAGVNARPMLFSLDDPSFAGMLISRITA